MIDKKQFIIYVKYTYETLKLEEVTMSKTITASDLLSSFQEEKEKGNRIHVISSKDRWGVMTEGSTKVNKYYSTKNEAIVHARELATKRNFKVVVHAKSGRVDEILPANV